MIPNKILVLIGMLTVATGAVAGCGSTGSAGSSSKIRVVAAENVWGDIVSTIGGTDVSVTSIVSDPNADPHTFESNPADAAAIDAAQLVIESGAGYDDFMDNLLSAVNGGSRTVVRVQTVVGASGSNPNPHFWYSPAYVTSMAHTIATSLTSLDAAHASAFATNLASFLSSYARYSQVISEIASRHRHATVAYTERVAGYLVQAAGMTLVSPAGFAQSIEDGNDPAPGDVAAMDSALTDHRAAVLLYNAQVTSPATVAVRTLATSSGIPVVGVAETIPAGQPGFVAWQVSQANAILAALGG